MKKGGTRQCKLHPYKPPHREFAICPACFQKIVWEPRENEKPVPCDPQLRLVVFSGFKQDLRNLEDDQVVKGIEVGTAKPVFGRAVTQRETDYYKKHKTLDGLVPWAMMRVSHFETCTGWDRWLSGEAEIPSTAYGQIDDTHEIEELAQWVKDDDTEPSRDKEQDPAFQEMLL